MAASPPRILLCGDVLGRLNQLYKRVLSVNKSTGPFDALLCVGQFLPDSVDGLDEVANFFEGRCQVPIPTYFTGGYGVGAIRFLSSAVKVPSNKGFKTDGLEVCPNLFWLKGSGKFSLHGLSVVYLSGTQLQNGDADGRYSRDDVDALRALAEDPGVVDIFLTNEWPTGVWNRSNLSEAPPGVSNLSGSDPTVAELAAEIKPRYHIAGTKAIFYAREPYSNCDAVHVTCFFGLAAVGNKEKLKFIHAISPTPACMMSATELRLQPVNTTSSPYSTINPVREQTKRPSINDPEAQYWRYDVSRKRSKQEDGASAERLCFKYTSSGNCPQGERCSYRHDEDARGHYIRNVCFDFLNKGKCERGPDCRFRHSLVDDGDSHGRRASQNGRSYRISEKKCWFCLSSPDVESHLVISIGESYYCALAKGPLVENHVLLIPIEHHPNTLTSSEGGEVELGKYKDALKIYYRNQEKEVVFFEWIFQNSPHANLQAVPVPLSKASNVQRIFNFAAKKLGFEFSVVAPRLGISDPFGGGGHSEARTLLKSQFDGASNLFYVELPDGIILSHTVDDKDKIPVQFGREVLAGLLNIADKADWRNCKLSKEEELKMVASFKEGFQQLDPAASIPKMQHNI